MRRRLDEQVRGRRKTLRVAEVREKQASKRTLSGTTDGGVGGDDRM